MSFILGLLGACLGIILAVAIIIGIILISLNKHLGAGSLKQILHAARNAKDIRKQEYSRIKNVSGMTKLMEPLILRDFNDFKNKQFKNSLDKLLPQKLIPVIIEKSGINPEKKVNEINKKERHRLVNLLKNFEVIIKGFRPIDEAIITSGGINIKEINPKTMESKLVEGLYFAGEIIDVDAYTGGFNLQIAYSTGYVAGDKI